MTNNENLKRMSVRELASSLDTDKGRCAFCAYYNDEPEDTRCNDGECEEGIFEWLHSTIRRT